MCDIRLDILITNVLRQLTKDIERYQNKKQLNTIEKNDIQNIKLFLESNTFINYCDLLNLDYIAVKNNYIKLLNKI